ncbi:MAG: MFS transporter [Micrococcales bacterium]|nr:MFS transporter [Micrococcales bacterium]
MPKLLADLTPLRVSPDFRRLWWGLNVAMIGTQFTIVAVGWEVYKITQSTAAVGMVGAWALVPTVVMGLYGGALADQHDRRKIALVATVVQWVSVIGLALQAYLGLNQVLVLYVLIAVHAGAGSVNAPARSAMLPRLVPAEHLAAANALRAITGTVAVLIGPMLAALTVTQLGYGPTYTIDAISFTAALYVTWRLPAMVPEKSDDAGPTVTGWRSVAQGLSFLATRKNIRMSLVTDMCAMVLAQPRVVFPAVGAIWIGGGETTAAMLVVFVAVGAATASVLSGPLAKVRRQGRAVVVSVWAWGAAVAGFGVVLLAVGRGERPTLVVWALVLSCVTLAMAGASDTVSMVFRNTIMQEASPDDLRGRLQGVFIVVVTGGPRIGDMFTGFNSWLFGEGWAVVIGGLACVLVLFLLNNRQRGLWHYDSRQPQP